VSFQLILSDLAKYSMTHRAVSLRQLSFLLSRVRTTMLTRDIDIAIPSVCLSCSGIISKQPNIPSYLLQRAVYIRLIPVFQYRTFLRNSDAVTPNVVLNTAVLYKFRNFLASQMFPPVKNYPILTIMLPAAAAITGVP